jgi:hypothetical protein
MWLLVTLLALADVAEAHPFAWLCRLRFSLLLC